MNLTRRRAVAAAMGIGLGGALVLAGCGDGGGDPDPSGTSDAAPEPDSVDLRILIWSANEGHLAILNEIADEFAEQSDSVGSVTIESSPAGENYVTVLTTQLAGGDAPDVGWLGEANSLQFIGEGALLDVADTLQSQEGYDFADVSAPAMTTWVDGDAIYGMPFSTSPVVIFYNADLFSAAGQPTPTELWEAGEWTWDALAESAATIHSSQDIPGFYVGPYLFDDAWQHLSHVFYPFGATPWSADGLTCQFNSPEMTEAMTLLNQMITVDESYPAPGSTVDFASGGAAMTSTYISVANSLAEASFEWGVVPLPEGPGGEVPVIGQSAFVAFSGSEHPAEAAELLAYLTTKESMEKLAAFFPPIRESLLNAETLAAANPVLSAEQIESVIVPSIANGTVSPVHAAAGELAPEIRSGLEPLWRPGADVQGTLDALCQQIQPILEG